MQPAATLSNLLRVTFWRLMLALRGGRMGRGCVIDRGVCLASRPGHPVILGDGVHLKRGAILSTVRAGRIVVEDDVSIGEYSVITSDAEIYIGRGAVLGPHTDLVDFNHGFDDPGTVVEHQPVDAAPIRIGQGVRLGANVKVLRGVAVGDAATVASGAVVTRDVEARAVAIGVPARIVRRHG